MASGPGTYGGADPRVSRARQRGQAASGAQASSSGDARRRPAEDAGVQVQAELPPYPEEDDQQQRRQLADQVNAQIVNQILNPAPSILRNDPFPNAQEVPPLNGLRHSTMSMRSPAVGGYYNWPQAESEDSDGSFEHIPEEDFDEPGDAINRLL